MAITETKMRLGVEYMPWTKQLLRESPHMEKAFAALRNYIKDSTTVIWASVNLFVSDKGGEARKSWVLNCRCRQSNTKKCWSW